REIKYIDAISTQESIHHILKFHLFDIVVSSLATHNEACSPSDALKAELEKKDADIKLLARELDQVRMKSASSSTANLTEKMKEVKGVKVLAHRVDNLERAQLRTLVDQL